MVPTAILADQHLESFKQILDKYNINIQILKSGMKKKEKTPCLKRGPFAIYLLFKYVSVWRYPAIIMIIISIIFIN